MQPDEVKQLLLNGMPDCDISVNGDGSHFEVTVVGAVFEGLRAVQRQQKVYAVLNEQIADGAIHAVNMKTFTIEEWQQQSQ